MKIIWIKVIIISMSMPNEPITHSRNKTSDAIYLYKCVNPTYTSDTIRMYSDVRFHIGDSVEVGIHPKIRIN